MLFRSVLYVSLSKVINNRSQVRALVDYSRAWNKSVGITGALVHTEMHFAQFFEGPALATAKLLANIKADTRHSCVDVIEMAETSERFFTGWTLAYSGPDPTLDRDLVPLLKRTTGPARHAAGQQMRALMQAMAKAA